MGVAVLEFLAFGASQVATPGPANMALMSTGAGYGFRAALPFVGGVVLGKQLVIWPVGFGLMTLMADVPGLLSVLKWASAAYICWLAWRIARMRLRPVDQRGSGRAPGFAAGLAVHPLNPKAWAMIATGFTSFVSVGTTPLQATASIAILLASLQIILHPAWVLGGDRLARGLAGTRGERYLMWTLAALTVASVLLVLLKGEAT